MAAFRHVLGHLPTGACVITTLDSRGRPHGLACNSFTSVSLVPPLVAFCPARTSTTWPMMRSAGQFAVNVLADGHGELCRQFSQRGIDRFAGVSWRTSRFGNPLLDDALVWLECVTADEHPAGDHTIVVAEVRELGEPRGERPLVFFRGRFVHLDASDSE